MKTSSATMMYECPHCLTRLEVHDEQLDADIQCPECDKPFHVDVPAARPVIDADGRIMDGNEDPDRSIDDEPVLRVFHAAEFRQNPIQFTFAAAASLFGIFTTFAWMLGYSNGLFGTIGFIALIGGLAAIGWWWILSYYTTLTITTERSIFRRGILSKETSEVQHDDVRNVQMDQSLLDRLLGVGAVAISSAGQGDLEIMMHGVPHPQEAVNLVRKHQTRTAQ